MGENRTVRKRRKGERESTAVGCRCLDRFHFTSFHERQSVPYLLRPPWTVRNGAGGYVSSTECAPLQLALLDNVLTLHVGRAARQTNIVVTGLTAAAVLYTRSAGVAYFAAGAVACSTSAKVVKKVIRQPRPISPQSHKKTYGCGRTFSRWRAFTPCLVTLFSAVCPQRTRLQYPIS